ASADWPRWRCSATSSSCSTRRPGGCSTGWPRPRTPLSPRPPPHPPAPPRGPAVGVAALPAVPVLLGLAAASSVVTDYGFVLARSGDNLVVRRGLLERREAVVPVPRVQVVRIEESL